MSGTRREVAQPLEDTLRHRHVMGVTGTGKSTLLARLVLHDITAGRGVVVIDPKTDLVDRILERIPPERLDDVVVLDPSSPTPVGVNPLAGVDPDLAADSVVSVFHSLFGSGLGPRSTDILHASVLSLARRGDAALTMVPLLLTTPGLRRSVVGRVANADPFGLGSFWATFEAWSDAERELAIRPLMNKLRQVMLRPSLRAVFGQRQPAFQLRQVFDERKILLVKLGKDSIGPEAASLLGSLLVNQLWQTALGRLSLHASQRHPVSLVIDEVQDYLRLPGSLGDALAQARGLGLAVTAAHQHRGQLGKLLDEVEANAVTKLYFRLAARDAREVASTHGGGLLHREDFLSLPAFHAYGQLLVAGALTPWVSLATERLPAALHDAGHVQQRSEARYGRSLDEVERDLLNLLDAPVSGVSEGQAATERPGRRRPTSADAEGGGR